MACNNPPWQWYHLLLFISCLVVSAVGTAEWDAFMLLKFKDLVGNKDRLYNWVAGSVPCPRDGVNVDWIGVLCYNGTVWGLQLENMELSSHLNVDALMGLRSLRTISFMNNRFDGPVPKLAKLVALKSVYLSDNRFSGQISEDAFEGMGWLKKVHLARNDLSGPIPASLTRLPRILELRLEENQFMGHIPDFKQHNLRLVNVSYNQLEGPIPLSLSKMDDSSFEGNKDLCGKPLNMGCENETTTTTTTTTPSSSSSSSSSSQKSSTALIIIILIVLSIVLALAIIGLIIILLLRQRCEAFQSDKINQNKVAAYNDDLLERGLPPEPPGSSSIKKCGKDHKQRKLLFLSDDRERFELKDLLKASAEVLGSGSFGSSYKTVLLNGPSVVVKRFMEMNGVGREDFQEHMRRLGRLRHPNLLPIVAFYYKKDEKLLVTDFVDNGSLVQLLHGNRGPNRPTLTWPMRLKIVKGVARGLSYLYNEIPILTLPHGHLKSSNVLLDDAFEPILTDYALAPVMNRDHATQLMVAYKSPEYIQHGQVTKKSDVWSLGILILEIMTGKFPEYYLAQGKGDMDLAAWVSSVARAEWTYEVFDSEMEGTKNGEMLKLLKIGLSCCEEDVEKRWELKKAVKKIEELRERDINPSLTSEDEMYSTRDEFSFS